MKKKKEKKDEKVKFDGATIQEAIEFVKAQNIKKVAHRPSGKLTWVHMVDLPNETRDAIRDYLTQFPDMSIHHLAQLAMERFLEVSADERIPYVLKNGKAPTAKKKTIEKKEESKTEEKKTEKVWA